MTVELLDYLMGTLPLTKDGWVLQHVKIAKAFGFDTTTTDSAACGTGTAPSGRRFVIFADVPDSQIDNPVGLLAVCEMLLNGVIEDLS